jgi:hypothetical protein
MIEQSDFGTLTAKTISSIIRQLYSLRLILKRPNRDNRAEDLISVDLALQIWIQEHGWLDESTLGTLPLSANKNLDTFFSRSIQKAHHTIKLLLICQWAIRRFCIGRISHLLLRGFHGLLDSCDVFVRDAFLD